MYVGTCDHDRGTDIDKNTACDTAVDAELADMDTDIFWILKECNVRGKYVYIHTAVGDWNLCEVQVWGVAGECCFVVKIMCSLDQNNLRTRKCFLNLPI